MQTGSSDEPTNIKVFTRVMWPTACRGFSAGLFVKSRGLTPSHEEVASDGFEAGVKTTEFRPGLIILDLFMPGVDGFELCKRLRENSNTSSIKILALTGYDTTKNRDRVMQAGADGYLAKPVQMSTLLCQIKGLLDAV
jgi:DNA-binding response OmpR family regulator